MPRKTRKTTKRQTPKARVNQPQDMYRTYGYTPQANNITESAFDLIKSRYVVIR